MSLLIGPWKRGVWDSGFKFQTGPGFRIQISNRAGFRIQISVEAVTFKFQGCLLGFIFQNGWDSGFKFQKGGIQDSNYVFRGPINENRLQNQMNIFYVSAQCFHCREHVVLISRKFNVRVVFTDQRVIIEKAYFHFP